MNNHQVRLTPEQLKKTAARNLLAMLEEISADGYLSDEEITLMNAWLLQVDGEDLPAMTFLRSMIRPIVADHVITDGERQEIVYAILRIMPEDASRAARLRYGNVNLCTHLDEGDVPASRAQIRLMKALGLSIPEDCTCENAALLITQALEKRHELSGRHRLVLRFWGREDLAPFGNRYVCAWLDGWYSGDKDRFKAWTLWSQEHPGCSYVETLKPGIGYDYLADVKTKKATF